MNQDDQRLFLVAAAVQAQHRAKEQAKREARNAVLLSQALTNSGQPMDPKLQAELERLIRAEAQRTEQENFDWACGAAIGILALIGLLVAFIWVLAVTHVIH
jgi:Flp pilus assembly protein TadB